MNTDAGKMDPPPGNAPGKRHFARHPVSGRCHELQVSIMMNAASAVSHVEQLSRRLLCAMREPGRPVTFSIGAAGYDLRPHDFDSAPAQADALMHAVKNGSRDRVQQRTFSVA